MTVLVAINYVNVSNAILEYHVVSHKLRDIDPAIHVIRFVTPNTRLFHWNNLVPNPLNILVSMF